MEFDGDRSLEQYQPEDSISARHSLIPYQPMHGPAMVPPEVPKDTAPIYDRGIAFGQPEAQLVPESAAAPTTPAISEVDSGSPAEHDQTERHDSAASRALYGLRTAPEPPIEGAVVARTVDIRPIPREKFNEGLSKLLSNVNQAVLDATIDEVHQVSGIDHDTSEVIELSPRDPECAKDCRDIQVTISPKEVPYTPSLYLARKLIDNNNEAGNSTGAPQKLQSVQSVDAFLHAPSEGCGRTAKIASSVMIESATAAIEQEGGGDVVVTTSQKTIHDLERVGEQTLVTTKTNIQTHYQALTGDAIGKPYRTKHTAEEVTEQVAAPMDIPTAISEAFVNGLHAIQRG